MVPKVIEKSFKYSIPEPKELFLIFQERFSKEKLPESWEATKPWTSTVLGIFDEIGRSLGYVPSSEYMRLDQTWEIRHPDLSTIVLALEVENTDNVENIIDDELQKLLDVKAFLKVLIFYPILPVLIDEEQGFVYPQIQQKIESAQIKSSEESYVILTATYVKPSSIIEVAACSFDTHGKGQDLGSFQVSYSSKD